MIFLSYSRQNSSAAADLSAALERRGHELWRDTSDIPGGSAWREVISQAIARSQAVVVLLSEHAMDSASVARELSLADEMGKRILPVVVGECEVKLSRLAYTLSGMQLIDGLSRPMSDVVADIEAALPDPSPPPNPDEPVPPIPSEPTARTSRTALVGGALGLLALALVVAWWLARDDAPNSSHPDQASTTAATDTRASTGSSESATVTVGTGPPTSEVVATSTTPPPDPNADALIQIAALEAQDQPVADSLRNSYIAQLSAKRIGLVDNGVTYGPVEVLQDHLALRNRYGAILVDGGVHGFKIDGEQMEGWFLTIVPTAYLTRAEATNWCEAEDLSITDCFAKHFPPAG